MKDGAEDGPDAPEPGLNGLTTRVKDKARRLGFEAVGFARADLPLEQEYARYEEFIERGFQGTMAYLAENAVIRRRLDTDDILPGAKSVICVARRYRRESEAEDGDPPLARRVARYARGHDYHNVVRRKLRRLAAFVRTLGTSDDPARARPMCDDIPVLERAWAARAGLGFIGKNGLLIVPGEGSFVLLGEVVTNVELLPDAPIGERCGSCTRCLDACPTGAFVRPFVLDPRRCVAYLTIELREAVPEEHRSGVGENLFGCDDCQTVCPFNGGSRVRDAESTRTFEPLPLWEGLTETRLLTMEAAEFAALTLGSPVKRAGLVGMARNAAIVLGNRGDPVNAPALREAAAIHPSPVVREAAAWALDRLRVQ